jgi:hypothetical protein
MNEDNQGQPSVADRSTEFVAVSGGEETSSAAGLLVTAYILMWGFIFLLVWLSFRRSSKLETRLVQLEAALQKAEQGQDSP